MLIAKLVTESFTLSILADSLWSTLSIFASVILQAEIATQLRHN
jgi:hypothetical protein